jgi:glycosyltransferase involved in cell wall biosynthesis
MSKAIATFTPTEYLECFAGTHVESMLHGTPPITTNFAVFPGTIPDHLNGVVGYRCNTLQDFVDAAKDAVNADHKMVRQYGERFLMDNVKHEFQKWFEDLYAVYESTISEKKGWHRLTN